MGGNLRSRHDQGCDCPADVTFQFFPRSHPMAKHLPIKPLNVDFAGLHYSVAS